MTNPSEDSLTRITPGDLAAMLGNCDLIHDEYMRLRAKALLSLFQTGKRRREVASVLMDNVVVKTSGIEVTFYCVKKRKAILSSEPRTKTFPADSKFTEHILNYYEYMTKHHAKSKYFFPSAHNVFGNLALNNERHLSGQQVYNIVKELHSRVYPHLFRSKKAEGIVIDDQLRQENSVITVYKVMLSLDLEKETTAWNYVKRFSRELITAKYPEVNIVS